jgi:hypothetical protein
MKKNWKILLVVSAASLWSCGPQLTEAGSSLAAVAGSEYIKLGFLPSAANESQGQIYASVASSYTDTKFCAQQTAGVETCYQSEYVKAVGSNKVYRITGDVAIDASLKIAVKAQSENGTEVKRLFSFLKQKQGLIEQFQDGLDRINQRLTPLPRDKGNFNLTAMSGQKSTLKDLFTTPYMMIEASSPGCGGCVQMAQMMNGNSENAKQLHELFSGKKCTKAILVDNLQGWKAKFPANTYVGKASYDAGTSPMTVLRSFGFQGNAIPAFIFVDREFNIIEKSVGSLPREIYNKCR